MWKRALEIYRDSYPPGKVNLLCSFIMCMSGTLFLFLGGWAISIQLFVASFWLWQLGSEQHRNKVLEEEKEVFRSIIRRRDNEISRLAIKVRHYGHLK